ncbi:hypothetical protein HMPREF1326_01291 [Akkermansia sp. KLE1605]|nr:hypothetical protein HMPREF1326_01291 [Akkermansia sp. KLE1605]
MEQVNANRRGRERLFWNGLYNIKRISCFLLAKTDRKVIRVS